MSTLMSSVPPQFRAQVREELDSRTKSSFVAYILLFLLGTHNFYLGKGFFRWFLQVCTVIGWIWLFFDLFTIPSMVAKHNQRAEEEVIAELTARRSMIKALQSE